MGGDINAELLLSRRDLDGGLSEAQAAVAYDLVRDIWSTSGELSPGAYKNATDPLDGGSILPLAAVVDQRFLAAAK